MNVTLQSGEEIQVSTQRNHGFYTARWLNAPDAITKRVEPTLRSQYRINVNALSQWIADLRVATGVK